ncbi:YqjK-like family protein [Candidatus Sodalis endolongispinus]|uniref:YqjK-like family protein n=1 Tax=Candidatus Sodalis endolongispinus TaxID=2812662 RepID=A0ABS5YDH1_9GAMM|nr:YqjK-like family protein [Candidatus Sodalis endolongispinus]MBT9432752.1 YqjK-like family protein [Candidatus Sodalis endolongispinus]
MSEGNSKHAKKLLLLRQIQQQRQALGAQSRQWLLATAPWDRRWIRVLSLRRYLIAGTSLLALYNGRHPSRLVRWAKRGIGILGAVKMVRKSLESR